MLKQNCLRFVSGLRRSITRNVVFLTVCVVLFLLFYWQHISRYTSEFSSTRMPWSATSFIHRTPPATFCETTDCVGVPNVTTQVDFNVTKFYEVDLLSENNMVNKLIRELKTEDEVIHETQRIHLNIFRKLIGKYKYAMLFNIAGFENKGDPAIGIGEVILLRRLNIELVFHLEDKKNTEEAIDYARLLSDQRKYTNESLVILLHGGGNLVSYAHQDVYRERIIRRFMEFEIFMFPQSFWIAPFTKQAHIDHFKVAYSSHQRLTFCYRDQFSFGQGTKLFPKARPLLVPDMAFQIGKVERFMTPIHDIVWLQRRDEEAPHYQIPEEAKQSDVIVADWREWLTPKENRTIENDFLVTANGMMFLQRGRVIITDRLHGHILSLLCGIPHVILNPINNKIAHYRDTWTHGLKNIEMASTPDEAFEKAKNLLERLDKRLPKIATFRQSVEYEKGMEITVNG